MWKQYHHSKFFLIIIVNKSLSTASVAYMSLSETISASLLVPDNRNNVYSNSLIGTENEADTNSLRKTYFCKILS